MYNQSQNNRRESKKTRMNEDKKALYAYLCVTHYRTLSSSSSVGMGVVTHCISRDADVQEQRDTLLKKGGEALVVHSMVNRVNVCSLFLRHLLANTYTQMVTGKEKEREGEGGAHQRSAQDSNTPSAVSSILRFHRKHNRSARTVTIRVGKKKNESKERNAYVCINICMYRETDREIG